uniref:amino acid adenylation domain-containing protein n=2 Tax=Gynuella sp. TaxID=2969146 RepID=UPI003D0E8723
MEISTTERLDRLIPLHTSQENVYFEQLLYPEDPIYNIACYQVLHSNTNKEKLKHCWETLHEYLDALQMTFHEDEKGYPHQNLVKDRSATFLENDFSSRENPETEAHRWMEARLSLPMDFMSGCISELSLIKLSDDKHFLFFRFHHIAIDGMGVHVLVEYFHKLYEASENNNDTSWLTSIPDYRTFAKNSKNYLSSSRYENDRKYWQDKLNEIVVTKLETFHNSQGSDEVTYKLPKTLSNSIKQFCEQHKTSYLVLLSSIISIYFSKLLNRPDIVFGTIVHGRGGARSKKTVGMFSNTVLIKCDIPEGSTLKQLTKKLSKELSNTLRHSRFPYSHLSRLSKKIDQSPADIIINCETFSDNRMGVNKKIETFHLGNKHEKQPLQIRLIDYDFNDELEIKITYNHRFFDDQEVRLMGKRLLNMLNHCIQDIEVPTARIPILPDEERDILLKDWNETNAEYLKDKTVHQLFESRVVESPDNIALIFDNSKLTYAELNHRANQLAHSIRQTYQNTHHTELTPNTLIALYLDRGFDMIVSILAVLKAGAAYVPISPEFPESRIQFILEDTQTPMLISQTSHTQTIRHICSNKSLSPDVIFCDEYNPQNNQLTDTPKTSCTADDLAYVLYTSGTTGQPKGVMIKHRNICHLIAAQNERFDTAHHQCALQFAAYVFDASAFELFVSLISGHQVVLCTDEQHRDPEMLAELISQHSVEIATLPPAILNQMNDSGLESLKTLITAGETPSPDTLRRFSQNRSVHNAYGPTETTVCASSYKINSSQYTSAANIGKPLINARTYVLDHAMNPVPIGIPGELYVGGAGLAGGYLNRPELTSERFIKNPFSTDSDKCNGFDLLYKTGDLARWLPDGNLEYLGRNDFQVKIRGYRIELGEIEHAMTRISGIRQAVVIDRVRHNSQYLAAYYVSAADHDTYLSADTIRHKLAELLPDYMVPTTFVELETIPLTINGKVDRRALPEPKWNDQENFTSPRNTMEQQICSMWREVLGLEQAGIHDDFFRAGGDSITAIQLVSKLRQSGWTLHVKDVFALPTVAQQAAFLDEQTSQEQVNAESGTLTGRFDLLPVQQWFFDSQWSQPNHWNQAFMIKLPADIDHAHILQALSKLALHHDMLRVRFENGQQIYQTDKDAYLPVLHILDIRTLSAQQLEKQLTDWQSHFDIKKGQLWCAALLTGYQDGINRLWFSAHHLVIDFVSWGIISEDLKALLTHQPLNNKTSSYRQWVEAVKSYATQNPQEIHWWRDLTNDSTSLPNPVGHHRKYWSLSTEKTQQLLGRANSGYHTETKDLLLAALGITLCELFQSDSQLVTMEGHGRENFDNTLDVSHTVGWFTTLYPVRLNGNKNIHEAIIETKEMLRTIPNKGIGYGTFVQAGMLPQAKLPLISFNYLGQLNKGTQQDITRPWQLDIDTVGTTVAANNRSQFLLSIDCAALEQGLQLIIDSQLSERQTDEFIQSFSQTLEQILNQCMRMSSTGGIHTASDFEMEPLFQQRLEALQQEHDIEAIFPATSLQQGFIHHYLTRPDDDAYRMQLVVDYQQPLDVGLYQQAWTMAAQRFPSLRTAFDWDVYVIQIITRDQSINKDNFNTHDLSALSDQEQQRVIEELKLQHRKPFDLSKPGLIRLSLIKRSDRLYTLIKTEHHSITDGWSGPVLIDTVHRYYDELCQGQHQEVIAETAYLQAQQYQRQQQDKTHRYWADIKPQFIKTNDISAMFGQRVDLEKMRDITNPADMEIIITGKDFNALKELNRQLGVTVNTILQFSWHKLLQTYTGDEQTIVGTIVSGRDIPITDIETSVGLYINTLPLAINWHPDITVEQMLQDTHQHIAALSSHSQISLAELQHDGHRLFHSLFIFENYPMSNLSQTTEIGTHMVIREFYEKADYPLVVKAYEYEDRLMMTLNYSQDWLQPLQAQRLCDQLKQIVMQVVSQSKQPIRNINLSEFDQVQLQRWNNTRQNYPATTLLDGFCTQVEHAPHTTAVITSMGSISYAELNRQRLALTYHLLDKGVTRSQLVGVLTDKGEAQVTATLAILSTGAAYLPLNVSWPAHRLQEVLMAGGVEHLLISRQQYHNHHQQAWLNNYQLTVVEDVCQQNLTDTRDRTAELPSLRP